jgi:hypothetical protein
MGILDLKGFSKLGDSTLVNDIKENLISFFDWGFLQKDNYININIPSSGYYGGDEHQLRLVDDPRYTKGQVWEGFRSNWVWESGVTGDPAPLVSDTPATPGVSGVYVNDTFYPVSTTGEYAHHINHPLGRVVFDSPIASTGVVTCEYSYKFANITPSNGLPWFQEIHRRSERSENSHFTASSSGDWSQLSQNRFQLPAVGLEVTNNRSFKGYQLGGSSYVYTDVLFHCVAEDPYMRDILLDSVSYQNEKTFQMYNLNSIADADAFPLDHNGVPASGALRFPDLISQYPLKALRLFDMKFDSVYTLGTNLYVGTVKCSTEVILGV